jgi:hypothetical protein
MLRDISDWCVLNRICAEAAKEMGQSLHLVVQLHEARFERLARNQLEFFFWDSSFK